jgi:hypothetical protein
VERRSRHSAGRLAQFCGAEVGIDLDRQYRSIRTKDNDYLQDRQAMMRGNHTGIVGIPNQDMAMWETMGPIADRSKERLGVSDVAIVHFRRIMVEAARAVRDGGPRSARVPARFPTSRCRRSPASCRRPPTGRRSVADPQPEHRRPPGLGTEARAD